MSNDTPCDWRDPEDGTPCACPAAFALIDTTEEDLTQYACHRHREALTMPLDKVVYIEGHAQ